LNDRLRNPAEVFEPVKPHSQNSWGGATFWPQRCDAEACAHKKPGRSSFSVMLELLESGARISDRRHNSEREVAIQHLGNFDAENSRAWQFLVKLADGHELVKKHLVDVAKIFATISGIQLPRDYTRRSDLVVKWFDVNLARLEPLAAIIKLEDLRPLPKLRRRRSNE